MKEPIGLWVTDTHLSENTLEVNFNIFTQLFTLCKSLGLNKLLHGGDVFTSRKGQLEVVLNAFKTILDLAKEEGIEILVIPGNHDKTSYVSDSSFLDAFDGHPSLKVIEAGSTLLFESGVSLHFLPYYDETLLYAKKLKETTDALNDQEINILLTHAGIDGVKNNGHVNVENDLKQDLFEKFHLVLVGHYHDRQTLGENIVYTGSAYQANFGEDINKGCTVLYSDGSYEFIGLDFPTYITVEVMPQDIDADLLSMIAEKSKEAKIKIKVMQEVDDTKRGMIAELESIGVKVEVSKESFSPLDKIGEGQVAFTTLDIIDSYDNWSTQRGIENAEFGREILKEVLQNVAN